MLFSRPRPQGLTESSTVDELFAAFAGVPSANTMYTRNLAAINDRLLKTHRLPLGADDLRGVEYVFNAFYTRGYAIRPSPRYDALMTATDQSGESRSYLASEEAFHVMKDLESKNLVVPVVGDFGGPKAIRAIGAYLKKQNATVSAFYLSNVEQYLYQDGKWDAFCRNVAMLPLDGSSTFIRATSGGRFGGFGRGGSFITSLGGMLDEVKACRRL